MKKIFIAAAFTCATFCSYSQNNTLAARNGTLILPEVKDWAIGFDASPFLDVIKGLFSSSDSSGSDYAKFTKDHPLTLYGKMVKDANTMWRVSARIHFGSNKTNYITELDSAGSSFSTLQYGSDVSTETTGGVSFGFGIEKRRGRGRVQGYYGPEVMLGYNTGKTKISYANQFSEDNTAPTIAPPLLISLPDGGRITEVDYGSQFNIGVRAFGGIEYFFMAKASIGAELGWGISFSTRGEPATKTEVWDASLNSGSGGVNRKRFPGDSADVGKTSGFNLDTDNAYGAVNLFFYF